MYLLYSLYKLAKFQNGLHKISHRKSEITQLRTIALTVLEIINRALLMIPFAPTTSNFIDSGSPVIS